MSGEKVKVPVMEGMFSFIDGKASLSGSNCKSCNEIFFPKKEKNFCSHCQNENLQDINLSSEGEIITYTVVRQAPAGGFYKGPVPFAYGVVKLPEGSIRGNSVHRH